MSIPPLPPELPADILALRDQLPTKPAPVTLTGRYVKLIPFDMERDVATLHAISNGSPITLGDRSVDAYDSERIIWRYMFGGPFESLEAFRRYCQGQLDAADGLPYTVFDIAHNHPIGMANYLANSPRHLKIELGSIWYSPIAQGTNANREATYLMLDHAFSLGYQRLEWKCNTLNERSRHSALRMGFKFEGIQEAHYISKDRVRDTAWFRILAREWLETKKHLESLLYRDKDSQ